MRKRHNLEPRMERCKEYLVTEPETRKGSWRKPGRGLSLEIGCGKGSFTCSLAAAETDCDLVAIEKVPDAMILAMDRAKARRSQAYSWQWQLDLQQVWAISELQF